MQDDEKRVEEIKEPFFGAKKRHQCSACDKLPGMRFHCSWCNIVYCNAECQNMDWIGHKVFCKETIQKWSSFIQQQEKFMRQLAMLETMKNEVYTLANQETTAGFMSKLEELTKEADGSHILSFEWLLYFLPFVIVFTAIAKSTGKIPQRVRDVFIHSMYAEAEKKRILTQFSALNITRGMIYPMYTGRTYNIKICALSSGTDCFEKSDPRKLSPCLARYRLVDPQDPIPPMHSIFLLCKRGGCFVFQAYDYYYTNTEWCDPDSETARRVPLCITMHKKDGSKRVGSMLLDALDSLTDKNGSEDSRVVAYFAITGVRRRLPVPMIVTLTLFNFSYLFAK